MQYSYQKWKKEMIGKDTKAMAILSFPAIQLLDINVLDLLRNSHTQAKAMLEIADLLPDQAALVSMMDLSLEAEAFGCEVSFRNDEVPTVRGKLISTAQDAENLQVPNVRDGRCGIYLDAIEEVVNEGGTRPVFAGVIGPFSLAGRLMDVSEIMMQCIMDPAFVKIVLEKVTKFLKTYIKAYKDVGAHGVILAEPLAGLLSPALLKEFSSVYIKEITDELQSDTFSIMYHNCGSSTVLSVDEILLCNCAGYHFGNAIHLKDILTQVPVDCLVFGNIDPVKYFRNGSVEDMDLAVTTLLEACGSYPNFVASSGCDIPPLAKWENIKQFYKSVKSFQRK